MNLTEAKEILNENGYLLYETGADLKSIIYNEFRSEQKFLSDMKDFKYRIEQIKTQLDKINTERDKIFGEEVDKILKPFFEQNGLINFKYYDNCFHLKIKELSEKSSYNYIQCYVTYNKETEKFYINYEYNNYIELRNPETDHLIKLPIKTNKKFKTMHEEIQRIYYDVVSAIFDSFKIKIPFDFEITNNYKKEEYDKLTKQLEDTETERDNVEYEYRRRGITYSSIYR